MSRRHPSVIPWTSRRLGKAASRFGSTSATLGFVLMKGARVFTMESGRVGAFLFGVFSLFAGAVAAVVGELLDRKSGLQLLQEDSRKPIVYLRSFKGESSGLFVRIIRFYLYWGSSLGSRFTLEEYLARVLSKAGPVVALGKPGERFATPGASRSYVRHDAWMELINTWIDRAGLVVIKADTSGSLSWEISRVVALKRPTSILIYLPSGESLLLDKTMFRKRRLRKYSAFRESVSTHLKLPAPESIGSCRFLWFGPSGDPILLKPGTDQSSKPSSRAPQESRQKAIWRALTTEIKLFAKDDSVERTLQPVIQYLCSEQSAEPIL